MQKLLLVDGNAILHRAYHALPPLTDRSGQIINAVYGFSIMLLKAIEDLKPSYLAVCFDTPKPTFRHKEYIGYQAQRPKMDSELSSQIKIVKDLLVSFGIPFYEIEGFEADDLIGTLAKKAGEKFEVFIATGDRDILQLVDDRVKVYSPIKGLSQTKIFDRKTVEEELGIKPEQIVDYKGLVGDASDNYPGVAGIGPKTAVKLLSRFGNIEKIYKNIDKIEKNVADKLKLGYKSAILSKNLAQIVKDAPLNFSEQETRFKGVKNNDMLMAKLKELGFKSLIARLRGSLGEKKKKNDQLKLV